MPALLNKKKAFIILIGIFILIFINSIALADGIVPCTGADCEINHLFELVKNISNVAQPIILAIAFALVVWAGIKIMTAEGDASKVKDGKNIIIAVGLGILIIYGAKFIITSFVQGLGGNTDWFQEKTKDVFRED